MLTNREFAPKKSSVTNFNILVCGSAGIGKSSFIDLFMEKFKYKENSDILGKNIKGTEIQEYNQTTIREATKGFAEKTI